jgi:peroxiredoxin
MLEPPVGQRVPEALAKAHVEAARGASLALETFWASGPAVVVRLRHYGCVGCSEQVTELAPRLDEVASLGTRIVLIGNGTPAQRDAFVARHALADAVVDVVTDPPLATYRGAGLVRSAWATVGPLALWETGRAMAAGHPHRPPEGDRTQQGGSMIVDARGDVAFFRRNRSIGDHAPTSDLIEVVLRLAIVRQPLVV